MICIWWFSELYQICILSVKREKLGPDPSASRSHLTIVKYPEAEFSFFVPNFDSWSIVGSIPATGRRDGGGGKSGSIGSPASSAYPPASSATSLPFNQLIGGAVSPSLLNTTTNQPLNYATNSSQAQVRYQSTRIIGLFWPFGHWH